MDTLPPLRAAAVAATLTLLACCRALAGAATLDSISVSPPVLHLRPCETATLEITGHYDDGSTRDLTTEPGVTYAFATGNAAQSGLGRVTMTGLLDDALTVSLDGVDSPPVPIFIVTPQDLSLCIVVGTSTTTTTSPAPTTTTSSSTTTSTTTTLQVPTTTPRPPTTTTSTTLPPEPEDAACQACVHDRIQHRFRIENHVVFHAEQVL